MVSLPQAVQGRPYAKRHVHIGMTETCTSVTMFPITQRIGVMGSAGQFLPGTKAKIIKSDGSPAKRGEVGELVVTGPSMALRYANNEEA